MPYLPGLHEIPRERSIIHTFGGYNHNPKINDGEWYDEMNLTSDAYPLFSQRGQRSCRAEVLENPQGLLAKDHLAWVDGSTLYYNGNAVYDGLDAREEKCPKQLVSMGAYICVFPDGVYYNTADDSDKGRMGNSFTIPERNTFTLCKDDGTPYDVTSSTASELPPEDPVNGQLWIDTSGDKHILKQWSSTNESWTQILTTYIKISTPGIGNGFSKYDGVTISGILGTIKQLDALNADHILYGVGTDYIIINGIVDQTYAKSAENHWKVERRVPDLDYVCECGNRLWGCFYGMSGGKILNEVYACKLGDFKNWFCYMGLSTDSYAMSVGTDGPWTGCIAYNNCPIFFKEDCVHKVYGTQPSAYQSYTTALRGVQRGSARSMRVINEILYYKSRTDVVAYDGSLPQSVSTQFGGELYHDAVAGDVNGKYYISMKDTIDQDVTFVYDTKRGVWHKEDAMNPLAYARLGDSLYYIDMDMKRIVDVCGKDGDKEQLIVWEAESGIIGYDMPDQKYASRFDLRLSVGDNSLVKVYIKYDSTGYWENQCTITSTNLRSVMIPVIPRRCDHYQIKISGLGYIKLYSMAKIIEQGSDDV